MKSVIFSLADCVAAAKQMRWVLLGAALICGGLVFAYLLFKPVTFTATATFKGGSQTSSSGLSKALEFLGGGESYSASDDPKVFLNSYPVMEEVARTLHLQLAIDDGTHPSRLQRIWHAFKAEKAQRVLKNKRPHSDVVVLPVPAKQIIPDKTQMLTCTSLAYPGEVREVLTLRFIDQTSFEVKKGRTRLGQGELGHPFTWEGGHFTLEASAPIKGVSTLTFFPLEAVTRSLVKSVHVKRSKDHSALVHVAYTHHNRQLATAIVNTTMEAFQRYLREEGRKKIAKQLSYLQQRQEETLGGLEEVMEEHKRYLEAHLDSGEMLLLESELEFMAQKQAEIRRARDRITDEMLDIHRVVYGESAIVFANLLDHLRDERPSVVQTLTVDGARALVNEHQHALDLLQMDVEKYDYCLSKLTDPDFDTSALSKVIDDPTLHTRFAKIHTLHRNLIDTKNWSDKERLTLNEELETERRFLSKHINDLKQGASLKDEVIRNRLRTVQTTMLYLLLDRFEGAEKRLRDHALKAAHFPEKWLTQKKIDLNTKLHTEMIESITKMIEAKNIGYHLDYLASTPLMHATPPLLPNSPHLLLGTLAGALLGLCSVLALLVLRETWLGPRATCANLKQLGKQALDYTPTLEAHKEIFYTLKQQTKPVTLMGPSSTLAHEMCALFAESGESVTLIDLSNMGKKERRKKTRFGVEFSPACSPHLKEVTLAHPSFLQQAEDDRLVIYTDAPLNSLAMRVVADWEAFLMLVVKDVRVSELPEKEAFYLIDKRPLPPVSWTRILPLLERLTSFSLFSREAPSPESPQTSTLSPSKT